MENCIRSVKRKSKKPQQKTAACFHNFDFNVQGELDFCSASYILVNHDPIIWLDYFTSVCSCWYFTVQFILINLFWWKPSGWIFLYWFDRNLHWKLEYRAVIKHLSCKAWFSELPAETIISIFIYVHRNFVSCFNLREVVWALIGPCFSRDLYNLGKFISKSMLLRDNCIT